MCFKYCKKFNTSRNSVRYISVPNSWKSFHSVLKLKKQLHIAQRGSRCHKELRAKSSRHKSEGTS